MCCHSAAYNGQKEAIKLLLAFQSRDIDLDVDCLSRYEETPLHIACLRGNFEVADYLERKGADIGVVDKDGNTVLHYGSSSNSQSVMEWLLRRPAVREKINMKNKVRFKITCLFCRREWSFMWERGDRNHLTSMIILGFPHFSLLFCSRVLLWIKDENGEGLGMRLHG